MKTAIATSKNSYLVDRSGAHFKLFSSTIPRVQLGEGKLDKIIPNSPTFVWWIRTGDRPWLHCQGMNEQQAAERLCELCDRL